MTRYRGAFSRYLEAIDANWDETVTGANPDALHDLRVAVRRTRSLLADAKHVVPQDVRARFATTFHELASATTLARDLDVAVDDWPARVGEHNDQLAPVFDRLRQRQQAARSSVAATLRSSEARDAISSWRAWLSEPVKFTATDARRHIRVVSKRRGRARLKRLQSLAPVDSPEARHAWRIQAKHLRYLVEAFPDGRSEKRQRKLLTLLVQEQEDLGRARDRLVQAGIVDAIVAETDLGEDTRAAAASLATALRDEPASADTRSDATKRLRKLL